MKKELCQLLKDAGIKEVILDLNEFGASIIDFATDDGRIIMNNDDFSNEGL